MIGYLLICFIDTERMSHDQKIVREITDLVNHADIMASEYTLLFKNDHFESTIQYFKEDVTLFLNDPFGIYDNENSDHDIYEYEKEYMPLYIYFVSSTDLPKAFCDYSNELDIHNCEEFHALTYNISCLDQMEILKKLQRPENDNDIMKKIIVSNGDKRKRLFQKFNSRHKN